MRLWAHRKGSTWQWHLMTDDMARSECGRAIPFNIGDWEQAQIPAGETPTDTRRICTHCNAMVRGDEKKLRELKFADRRSR